MQYISQPNRACNEQAVDQDVHNLFPDWQERDRADPYTHTPSNKAVLFGFDQIFYRHPVVGYHVVYQDARPYFSAHPPLTAFRDLCLSNATTAKIPGADGSVLTLSLIRGRDLAVDLAARYLWRPVDARRFVVGIRDANLIDDELFAELLQMVPADDRRFLSKSARAYVLSKTSGRCVYCGMGLTMQPGYSNSFHVDHVLAVACGGTDDAGNLVPACATCNSQKRARTFRDFTATDSAWWSQ